MSTVPDKKEVLTKLSGKASEAIGKPEQVKTFNVGGAGIGQVARLGSHLPAVPLKQSINRIAHDTSARASCMPAVLPL